MNDQIKAVMTQVMTGQVMGDSMIMAGYLEAGDLEGFAHHARRSAASLEKMADAIEQGLSNEEVKP